MCGDMFDVDFDVWFVVDCMCGFDWCELLLMWFMLICVMDDVWWVVWMCYYVLFDGWSIVCLLVDVLCDYCDLDVVLLFVSCLVLCYCDFIVWFGMCDCDVDECFWIGCLVWFDVLMLIVECMVDCVEVEMVMWCVMFDVDMMMCVV